MLIRVWQRHKVRRLEAGQRADCRRRSRACIVHVGNMIELHLRAANAVKQFIGSRVYARLASRGAEGIWGGGGGGPWKRPGT